MKRIIQHQPPDDFAERAPGMTFEQIQRTWKIGKMKAKRWLASIGIDRPCPPPKQMPDGFAEAAPTTTAAQLRQRFGLTKYEVEQWRKVLGLTQHRPRQRMSIPDNFRSLAQTMTAPELAERYGVSPKLVTAWRRRLGIAAPTPRYHRDGSVKVCRPSARSVEDLAADHLRRNAPVYRCGTDGRPNPRGISWRYGNIMMSGTELLSRAQRRGWNPDAWREIRA